MRRTRESLASLVASIGTPEAIGLAKFATQTGAKGEIPCWGAIVDHLLESVTDDGSLRAMWDTMVGADDPRPLLILLRLFEDRPKLVDYAARDEAVVSPVVRQALRALREPDDAEARRGFDSRLAELMAFQYVVPDRLEPSREAERRSM